MGTQLNIQQRTFELENYSFFLLRVRYFISTLIKHPIPELQFIHSTLATFKGNLLTIAYTSTIDLHFYIQTITFVI